MTPSLRFSMAAYRGLLRLYPAELRRDVTSPGGTTEAALATLMKDDALMRLVADAVAAARRRSEELSA